MTIPTIAPYSLTGISETVSNRVAWSPEPERSVLLIHDMQQYFLDFFETDQEPVLSMLCHIQRIKQLCTENGVPVVYTAQPGNQDPEERALLTDFWGKGLSDEPELTRILPELAPASGDTVLTKWRYSAFQRTKLKMLMDQWQRDQLIVVGVYAHIGCLQTAMEAFMSDIQAFLVADAVADFTQQEHQMALSYVAARGGYVLTTGELVESYQPEVIDS